MGHFKPEKNEDFSVVDALADHANVDYFEIDLF